MKIYNESGDEKHITIGGLIEALSKLPPGFRVVVPGCHDEYDFAGVVMVMMATDVIPNGIDGEEVVVIR